MHIHPAAGLNAIDPHAFANQRAANARAAETRKKLLKAGQSDDSEVNADPDAILLIGHWLDSRQTHLLPGDQYHSAAEDKDFDLG
jgi:hypothetical protein